MSFLTYSAIDKPSWGATVWIWTSEVFSLNVRAQAVGMASQTQNVANAIVQQFFPQFLTNCGFYAFYMFCGVNFLLAAFVYFFVPETRKVSLEEIDTLFGGTNHVEKGADLLHVADAHHATITGPNDDIIRQETRVEDDAEKINNSHIESVDNTVANKA